MEEQSGPFSPGFGSLQQVETESVQNYSEPHHREKQLELLGMKIPENPNPTGIPKREHHGTRLASDTA